MIQTVTNNSPQQINAALFALDNSLENKTASLEKDIEALKKNIKEDSNDDGIISGKTYDINISGNADTADYATRAEQDADGNTISSTYVKLEDLPNEVVTGVKGDAETDYRKGNVNITPANIGAATSADITNAINALDVAEVGGDGKYISKIKETDGKISATVETMDTTPTSASTKAVTSGGVYTAISNEATARDTAITNAINALDVAEVGGGGKYIRAIKETNGKISATVVTMDTAPTADSTKAVTSGGIKSAIFTAEGNAKDLANAIGTLAIDHGGTGTTSQANINKKFIADLSEGASDVTDGTMFVSSYASDNGFSDTNAVNKPYKRKFSHVWNYIKGKIGTVFGLQATKTDNAVARWDGTDGKLQNSGVTIDDNADMTVNNVHIGKGKSIYADGTKANTAIIKMKDNTSDAYGNGIVIGGGGAVVIGAGESADTYYSGASLTPGDESTRITADGSIVFASNLNSNYASRKEMTMGTDGKLTNNNGFVGDLTGNSATATTANYPTGFRSRSANATWGDQTGATITTWNESDGGSIDFRKNNPSAGKLSVKVDGRYYMNEGNTPVAGLKSANSFWGMTDPDGNDNAWIRTTNQGIIPYQSGGAGSGHNYIGTSSWYFAHAYIDQIHGYLNGNISGSSTSCTGNSATATTADNADKVDGYHASESAIGSTVGVRNPSGYFYASIFHDDWGEENINSYSSPKIMFKGNNDGYIRNTDPSNVKVGAATHDGNGNNIASTYATKDIVSINSAGLAPIVPTGPGMPRYLMVNSSGTAWEPYNSITVGHAASADNADTASYATTAYKIRTSAPAASSLQPGDIWIS